MRDGIWATEYVHLSSRKRLATNNQSRKSIETPWSGDPSAAPAPLLSKRRVPAGQRAHDVAGAV